jgi:hypothetical protein
MALDWIEPHYSNPESPYVPSLEVRTYDLHKKGRLPTPTNVVTGIVDRVALINLVKDTVIPGYDWTSSHVTRPKKTRHHLLWPHAWYEGLEDLRNHGTLSAGMSQLAHSWAHEVTYPSKPPTAEAAHHYVEAYDLVDAMQVAAKYPSVLARETLKINFDVFGAIEDQQLETLRAEIEEDKHIDLEHQLETFSKLFEAAKAGPKEFQVVNYADMELQNVTDMLRIVRKIGRQVVANASVDRLLIVNKQDKIAA